MSLADTFRKLGLGRIVYRAYHRPRSKIRDIVRAGGPLAMRRTEAGRRAMLAAAATLPRLPEPLAGARPVELHVLTGRRFWYQTMFCLWSFARNAGNPVVPLLYDDGTLDDECLAPLREHFPGLRVETHSATLARLDRDLPRDRFPHLRERWDNYPNLRKLIDVHLGRSGWKLVLDSDMLFFRRPDFLLNWLSSPDRPLHGVDCIESYGYSRDLMENLTGVVLAPRVNVGLCGLRSEAIDWERLESWTAALISRERTNYYLEQALVAMLVAGTACAVAPSDDYLTLPTRQECLAPSAVMHHYVDTAKRWYFTESWRLAAGFHRASRS